MGSPTANDEPPHGRKGSRWQLALVLVVFLGPVLAAVLLYANADRWLASGPSGQHGQLFEKVEPLAKVPFASLDGEPMEPEDLRGKWTVVVMGSSACQESCRQTLYKVRQAHKAQGKNIGRVQRLFVALDGVPAAKARDFLASEHPHLDLARTTGSAKDMARFRHPRVQDLEGVYVLDPHANLVLRYAPEFRAKGLIEDLESLLKHSTIG
ncbi:SCO family protein [Thiohalorhabdus sp.]|uniref:SCO family protein n=1 Tax=Thiohalorhabdus sp. TaxID=3094134 RepID=UPI002FC300A9